MWDFGQIAKHVLWNNLKTIYWLNVRLTVHFIHTIILVEKCIILLPKFFKKSLYIIPTMLKITGDKVYQRLYKDYIEGWLLGITDLHFAVSKRFHAKLILFAWWYFLRKKSCIILKSEPLVQPVLGNTKHDAMINELHIPRSFGQNSVTKIMAGFLAH